MTKSGTIAAIASPRGAGARGVIRVSGPNAWSVVQATWCGAQSLPDGRARGFHRGRFDDGGGEQPLLLLWMPGPRSFTREDVAEFHLPGSPPLLDAALARILSLDVRPAEAGEFTRRAFENGRIDLTRAEGILELVNARNEAERRSASALMLGGLAERLEPLRLQLDSLRALAEASLDFDEADTGHVPAEDLEAQSRELLAGLREASQWEARRVNKSDLPQVVLVGAPNAGKSSLFNALVPKAVALVSDHSGTTRDVLRGEWETGAGAVRLTDTAGLERVAQGPDGTAQVHGARSREVADLELWLADPAHAGAVPAALAAHPARAPRLLIWTKSDLGAPPEDFDAPGLAGSLSISVPTSKGLDELARRVAALLWPTDASAAGAPRLEREVGVRHQAALRASAAGLQEGLEAWLAGLPLDLFAESLRSAGAELDAIGGTTSAEDLLTHIFSSFCIGK